MFLFLLAIAVAVAALLYVNRFVSKARSGAARTTYDYDVIIVGGSIAGPVLAKALSDQGRKVLMLERQLFTRPDRIVGELLQPGGLEALKQVGMDSCATSIGMPCHGYLVVDQNGEKVDLPYREGNVGVSFHFGEFVNNLRAFVFKHCKENVTFLEATVTNILTEGSTAQERAYGVEYNVAEDYQVPQNAFEVDPPKSDVKTVRKMATAPLVVMCDGGMSRWKGKYQHYTPASDYHSNFVGLVLKTVRLPVEQRGTVFFGKTGPILSYRLDDDELRFLVDYNKPSLPSLEKQSEWLINEVAPCLPEHMRAEFIRVSKDTASIRSMPVARYPPTFPAIRGYVGIGDHNNQRHPLTGGGMTCAFRDAVRLANNLKSIPDLHVADATAMAAIEDKIHDSVIGYTRFRYIHSCCINLLSWALYAVFSCGPLRDACFDYFKAGGDCVMGPMDLLSGLDPNVGTLIGHYYNVMFQGVGHVMCKTGAYAEGTSEAAMTSSQRTKNILSFFVDPARMKQAAYLLVKSTMVAVPLAKNEFFSVWRFIDPTSALAIISKRVKEAVYARFYNGKTRKPVGL